MGTISSNFEHEGKMVFRKKNTKSKIGCFYMRNNLDIYNIFSRYRFKVSFRPRNVHLKINKNRLVPQQSVYFFIKNI